MQRNQLLKCLNRLCAQSNPKVFCIGDESGFGSREIQNYVEYATNDFEKKLAKFLYSIDIKHYFQWL